ncbi:Rieske (2Fe-2S) protein [Streptomyces purpureus]|uniref:Cytochrome bc1 complex Rieske iron-sulfur subunit n=1 Tax=Streptomyces purpureus TaxID=1951 RepID=A0A918LVZ6_9ACTN|nr:Rieske (2Fe-2S) protein [Streptomyces purpureus]GGT60361.1 iron-sulfur protein [Streptomyces purpureus]
MTGSQGTARNVARRTVVAAAGGAGLAAALTACGGSDTPAKTVGEKPADGGAGAPAGGGEVLATTADIPVGGGKVFADKGVVVTQPQAGQFKAFSSKCTHQGCAVSGVSDGVILCPCHQSKFDAGDGSVKGGPATTPLPAANITVDGTSIKLA